MLTSILCSFTLSFAFCQSPSTPDCYVDASTGLIVCLQPVEPTVPVATE